MKVSEYFESVWMPHVEESCRPQTVAGYKSTWRLYVEPTWGEVELSDVAAPPLADWAAALTPGVMPKALGIMRMLLRRATFEGVIEVDPTRALPPVRRRPMGRPNVLEEREVRMLLKGFFGHQLEPWLLASVTCGLRREEACALAWADIDLRTGAVNVSKTLQVVERKMCWGEPKTALSRRTVYLPPFARKRMAELKRPGYLTGEDAMNPEAVAARYRRWCHSHSLPYVPPKDLRHTFATISLAAGVDVAVVASMLGHSELATTYRYYLCPGRKVYQDAAKAWERRLIG